MSFGISIGDALAVSKFALDIWGRVQDSSDQFKAIRTEFRNFYIGLDDTAQSRSKLNLDQEQSSRLQSLVQGSQGVLDDTNAMLEKFDSLGTKSLGVKAKTHKAWKKVTWDEGSIKTLRDRIISNTTLLNAFIASIASEMAQSTDYKVTVLDGRVQKLQSQNDDQEHQKILDWISPLEFSSQQSAILSQRQEGTGKWFLESGEFKEWMSNNHRPLHCIGMPGAGKTILASIAIEHFANTFRSRQDIGVAYIFCDYKAQNEQTPRTLLASLLKQFLQFKSCIPEDVRGIYERGRNSTAPGLEEVTKSLQLIAASFSQAYIIVDALDELQQTGQSLKEFLSALLSLQATSPVSLLLTSRDLPHVTDRVQSGVRLEVRARDEDVGIYVDGHLDDLPNFVSKAPKMQQTIKEAIVSAVDGMFLLARLHLQSLADKMNTAEVRTALESLPKGRQALSSAYDEAMRRILAQDTGRRCLARKTLRWITYAERLLTVRELQHALGIQYGTSNFDEDRLYDIDDIISACAGLVIVDNSQQRETLRLVHYSTQEFLRQTGDEYFPDARQDIATSCLTYLLYDSFEKGWWSDYQGIFNLEQQYPFLLYAARYWATHASRCPEQSVKNLMIQFLRDKYRVSSAAQVLLRSEFGIRQSYLVRKLRLGLDSQAGDSVSGMHLATYFGAKNIVLILLETGFAPDVRDACNRSPLFWAAVMGHAAIVELLLSLNKNCSNLENRDDGASGPCLASVRDPEQGSQLPALDDSISLDTTLISNRKTSAWRATEDGSGAFSELPLTVNVIDVNCQDKQGSTPLIMAASIGHSDIVRQLLNQVDISADAADKDGNTPLSGAVVQTRDPAILSHFIGRAEVDVNRKFPCGLTALNAAVASGNERGVQILLRHPKIDLDIESAGILTPLVEDIFRSTEGIAKLLLAHHNFDLKYKTNDGKTALTLATECGYEEMVKSLLARAEIDLNPIDSFGHTPLSRAVYGWLQIKNNIRDSESGFVDSKKYEAITKLLLTRTEVDVECIDAEGNNLLSRVTKYARETSEPRSEGVIALPRAAMEDRSKASCGD